MKWKEIQEERELEQRGNKRTGRRIFRAGSHIRWGSRTDGLERNKKNITTVRIRRGEGERGLPFISDLLGNVKEPRPKKIPIWNCFLLSLFVFSWGKYSPNHNNNQMVKKIVYFIAHKHTFHTTQHGRRVPSKTKKPTPIHKPKQLFNKKRS